MTLEILRYRNGRQTNSKEKNFKIELKKTKKQRAITDERSQRTIQEDGLLRT
jgi:hypothetical protein